MILPLAITLGTAALMLAWLPRMPDPSATHWGPAGEPDGFGPPWLNPVLIPGTALLLTAMYGISAAQQRGAKPTRWSSGQRLIPAVILSGVVLVAGIGVSASWSQLDASDARATGPILWGLIWSGIAAVAAGVIGFFAQPKLRLDGAEGIETAAMSLAPTEQAVWVREVRASRAFLWVGGASIVLIAALAVPIFFADPAGGWIMLGTLLLLIAVILPMTVFRVRVDGSGIVARSFAGWPRVRVPAADVAEVAVAEVQPFSEFGGWGLRLVPGTTALVMRAGEALVVTRRSGRTFVATVDDADTAAALLRAAATRAVSASPDDPGAAPPALREDDQ
nr:DUF1648 domain-containing protein [Leucobacter luti]